MATALQRSLSEFGGLGDGLIVRGRPMVQSYCGRVIWVDSNDGGGNGSFKTPVGSLSAALALVVSGNGDKIFIKNGHAETVTSTISSTKDSFSIIGLGEGSNRPVFTNGITISTDDAFDFTGNNVSVQNIYWAEAAPAGDTVTIFNMSGNFCSIEGCYLEMGAKTIRVFSHDTTAKKGFRFIRNTVVGTAAGPTIGIQFEKKHSHSEIMFNKWLFGDSSGCDTGIVIHTSGAGTGHLLRGDVVMGQADGEKYLVSTVNQTASMCADVYIVGADATDNLGDVDSYGFIFNLVAEDATGVPAEADFAGARPPSTTPAS